MMLKRFKIILFLSFVITIGYGQNSDLNELKQQKLKYQEEIKQAQILLSKKGKSRTNILSEVNILNSKISSQQKIIDVYREEIEQINSLILSNKEVTDRLDNEILLIKEGYAKLVIEANKQSRSNFNEFMLLFSAGSFSEAYRRFNLMRQYATYRKKQGQVLVDTKLKYDSIIHTNEIILEQKKETFNSLNEELEGIKLSISNKEKFISDLQKEEKWLKDEIKKKSEASSELEKTIEKLILEASKTNLESYSNFNQAKGILGWPVQGGVVTSNFGEHNHAVLKGVKVKNNGIDITAPKENIVKAVYEGTVSRVIAIPGYNKAIIVRHGKYLTVYANLVDVFVKSGDSVKSSQNLGLVFADENDNRGVLHFEIWEGSKKINPTLWLKK